MKLEDIQAAIKLLRGHNEWRRGAETPMCAPKDLGKAVDRLCDLAAAVIADRESGMVMVPRESSQDQYDKITDVLEKAYDKGHQQCPDIVYQAALKSAPQSATDKFFKEMNDE